MRIHRFRDTVAIHIGTGQTVYISVNEAERIAEQLLHCVGDVQEFSFQDSKYKTYDLNLDDE